MASKPHSGIVVTPDGVMVGGKGIHTIDDVETNFVCSEVRKFINQDVPEARRADVQKAIFGNSSGRVALNTDSKRRQTEANPTPALGFPTTDSFDDSDDYSDDDLEGAVIDKNCDQIRRKIRNLIDSKEMKVGEFCDAIGVSNKSYNTFLGQSGPSKGMGSATFHNAWAFFKKREMKGVPESKNNKKRKLNADSVSKAPQTDISDVHLEGEEIDSVEIYDTCDEVRRKINAYLKKDEVTQAQFLRDLAAQFRTKNQRIQSSQLAAFRNKKGPDAGNTSCVYYAAYCFFEKLRIKKSKKNPKKIL